MIPLQIQILFWPSIILIYLDISWYILIYLDISWYILIYLDIYIYIDIYIYTYLIYILIYTHIYRYIDKSFDTYSDIYIFWYIYIYLYIYIDIYLDIYIYILIVLFQSIGIGSYSHLFPSRLQPPWWCHALQALSSKSPCHHRRAGTQWWLGKCRCLQGWCCCVTSDATVPGSELDHGGISNTKLGSQLMGIRTMRY